MRIFLAGLQTESKFDPTKPTKSNFKLDVPEPSEELITSKITEDG